MKTFKRHKDYDFWDQDFRLSKLSKLGDPLERLNNGTVLILKYLGICSKSV